MQSLPKSHQIYIAIDDAVDMKQDILTQILEIPTYNNNIAVITISITPNANAQQVIHFPAYTKEQLLQLLYSHTPTLQIEPNSAISNAHLWKSFVTALHGSIAQFTRDINEIKRFAELIWPKYIEPIEEGYG